MAYVKLSVQVAAMRAITYTEARNNLASELDRVANDCEVTIITRQKAEAGVLMSLREYESLMETAHLLRQPPHHDVCVARRRVQAPGHA